MTKIGVDYETERVNFNIPKKLMNKVREYAKNEGVPITYGLQMLLKKGLELDTSLITLQQFNRFIEEYKDGLYDDLVKDNVE